MSRRTRTTAGLVAAALLLGACSGSTSMPSEITAEVTQTTTGTTTAPLRDCTTAEEDAVPATASYPALDPMPEPGEMPPRSTMARILSEGRLVVGVSGDTLLFGARNPFTTQIEGFDIDILTEVANAIFGEDGAKHIEYKVITYADRIPKLEARNVDIVAHTMTINCRRWLRINFSTVYFWAGQKVLVKTGSGYRSIDDFEPSALGGVVCAPNGSTNIDKMAADYPDIEVIGKDDISDCLVAMQQGEADATTGDDTVLAGFAAQDPNTEVVGDESGKAFTDEPYGLGMNKDDVDFVQFVNGVLAEIRDNGRYDEIVQKWLIDTNALDNVTPVPPPDYSRPLP